MNTLKSLLACGILSLTVSAFGASAKPAAAKQPAPAKAASAKPSAASTPSASGAGQLDQVSVKSYYNDGDFPPAITILEDFQHANARFTREESVMVYKYLGVMYSADQSTREKGKSYFYKLLAIDPQAKILDMYVSIVVQDIFKSTLDELMGTMPIQNGQGSDKKSSLASSQSGKATGSAGSGSAGREAVVEEKKSHRLYWWLGGIGLAAGIAGGYYAYTALNEEKSPDTDIAVP